jgi:RNA polymerase sigma-B factor
LIGDPDPALLRAETQVTVRALLARLPEREQRIRTMRFYRGMTQASTAGRLGVSQMHISRLINQTITRLRERMRTD